MTMITPQFTWQAAFSNSIFVIYGYLPIRTICNGFSTTNLAYVLHYTVDLRMLLHSKTITLTSTQLGSMSSSYPLTLVDPAI